jgi:hypothetical protein
MKSVRKFVCIILFFVIIMSVLLPNISNAAYDMMKNVNAIADASETDVSGATAAITSTKRIAGAVITITRIVAAGIAIIMISVLAMKYMTAAPSEKADIKKHAIPFVVGAIIMFSVSGILGIIQKFSGIFSQS